MYEKTQRDVVPVEMVQSSSELEGHPTEEEGLPEGVNGMEERVMRDRMIGLIQSSVDGCARHWAEVIADHLLESGAILPPCKVGDDIWWVNSETNTVECQKNGIKAVCWDGEKWYIVDSDNGVDPIGNQWTCLTKEDAEKFLKGGGK